MHFTSKLFLKNTIVITGNSVYLSRPGTTVFFTSVHVTCREKQEPFTYRKPPALKCRRSGQTSVHVHLTLSLVQVKQADTRAACVRPLPTDNHCISSHPLILSPPGHILCALIHNVHHTQPAWAPPTSPTTALGRDPISHPSWSRKAHLFFSSSKPIPIGPFEFHCIASLSASPTVANSALTLFPENRFGHSPLLSPFPYPHGLASFYPRNRVLHLLVFIK